MFTILALVLFSGLLRTATSTTLYPQTTSQRPPTLLNDFQKNNVSSSWAPGHPKEWTDRTAVKYSYSDGGPVAWTSGALRAAELSSDEKYLVAVNATNHVTVVDFATGATVSNSTLTTLYTSGPWGLRVLDNPAGGYDVLVSMEYYETHGLRLSPNGVITGNTTVYPGALIWERGSPSVSHSGRRFITVAPTASYYNLWDLDDANVHLNLSNQVNTFYDGSFTPDDQYVVLRSYGYSTTGATKMFNAATGALVRDFGDTFSDVLSISPDGNQLATSYSWEALQIWSLRNATSEPVMLTLPTPILSGFTSMKWSPDGKYLAAGTYQHIYIWDMTSSSRLVQHWYSDHSGYDVQRLLWLGGTKQLAYRTFGGLEIYDFESNLKYRWGFGSNSHWVDGPMQKTSTYVVKSKGWVGGLDADGKVRFWDYSL